jgi:hypothetical protein
MDLAAVFLLSLLGGYYFASLCHFTAYSTRRVEGHHLYFRAALFGVIFFAASLLLRRCMLLNATYSNIDAALIKYVLPVLKDDAATPHPLDQAHRAEWVVTAMYSLVIGPVCASLINLLTPTRWATLAAERSMGPLDRLLLRTQQQGVPVLLTLDTGKAYIGVVQQITDPEFNPAVITILPMFSGHRDDLGRLALTTDYESVYNSLPKSHTGAPPDLTQFYLLIRADSIVSANQFSPALYARFHPGWRQKMVQRNQPPPPQELIVRLKQSP